MGLLDNVQTDPDPVSVVLSFTDYVDGEKLSTLARQYFASKGSDVGAETIEEYFAQLLLIKLKETLVIETRESADLAKKQVMEEMGAMSVQIEEADSAAMTAIEEIQGIILVKKLYGG